VDVHRVRTWATWVFLLIAAACLATFTVPAAAGQTTPPTHPLEGLKSQEYWAVYEVLRGTGKIEADTYCVSVLLHEPNKEKVLAWSKGEIVSREADVILLRKGATIEVRVDIAGRKVESWRERKDVQAPTFDNEFFGLGEEAKNDPQLREALAKHGVQDFTTVVCVPLPIGYFALPEQQGRRLFYGDCFDSHGSFLTWGVRSTGCTF
jgi:primary-amine oxidase